MADSYEILVLVVTRDKPSLQTISEAIGHLPCNLRIVTAMGIPDAVKRIDRHDVALALIDISASCRENIALAGLIKEKFPERLIPMIFMVNQEGNPDETLEAYAQGALDVLSKPLSPRVLQAKIGFFADLYVSRKALRQDQVKQPSKNRKDLSLHVGRAVTELAGGIAHQFNNALNIITGNVELLKLDVPNNEYVTSFGEVVFESVRKMTVLTDKLLAYARAGHYNPSQVEFNGVLKQVLSDVDTQGKKIDIVSHLDNGLVQVDADEAQLKIVFAALVKNAMEAIDDKGRISVRSRYIPAGETQGFPEEISMKNMVCLEVEDNGKGMEPAVVERIFEPFFSTKFQGRGLDMAAVHGIVSNHKGFIDVDSDVGKGTKVSVFLPVSSYKKPTVFHSPESLGGSTGNVLVIDDDEALMGLTVTMLKRLGYHPLTASTGKEAISILNRPDIHVDLALLDIEMPDMRGNEIFPYLKLARPDLKVVVCSGYSLDGPVQELLEKGAHMFLQKPFSFGSLAQSLRSLIERRAVPRYEVKDGFIIVSLGRKATENDLIDISQGGASIHCFCYPEESSAWKKLTIVADEGQFKIPEIPFQIINTHPFLKKSPHDPVEKERLSLRFGPLSPIQIEQVDCFISSFTM